MSLGMISVCREATLTLRSKSANLFTRSASRGLLFALNLVYSSLPNTVLSLIEYIAAHCGCLPSAASNRVAVWKVESVEVLKGICSSPYHSVQGKQVVRDAPPGKRETIVQRTMKFGLCDLVSEIHKYQEKTWSCFESRHVESNR